MFCVPRFASEFFISVLRVLCSVFLDSQVSEVSKWEYERHHEMQQQVQEHGDALQMVKWVGFKSEAEKAHQLFSQSKGLQHLLGSSRFERRRWCG